MIPGSGSPRNLTSSQAQPQSPENRRNRRNRPRRRAPEPATAGIRMVLPAIPANVSSKKQGSSVHNSSTQGTTTTAPKQPQRPPPTPILGNEADFPALPPLKVTSAINTDVLLSVMRQNINHGCRAPTTPPSTTTTQLDETLRAAIKFEVRAALMALVPSIVAIITTCITQLLTLTFVPNNVLH